MSLEFNEGRELLRPIKTPTRAVVGCAVPFLSQRLLSQPHAMEDPAPSKVLSLLLTTANRQITKNVTESSPELYNRFSKFLVGLFDFKLPEPTGRRPLTLETFATHLCVPLLLNYVIAYLVLVPGTRLIRLAILPISLWTLFSGVTTLDVSMGEPGRVYLNQGLAVRLHRLTMSYSAPLWQSELTYFRPPIACLDHHRHA